MKSSLTTATRHKSEIVYWTRFGLATLSAILCAILKLSAEGLAVGIVIYLISYLLARYAIKPDVTLGRHEIYLLGLGTYFATWFTLWILIYTLLETSRLTP